MTNIQETTLTDISKGKKVFWANTILAFIIGMLAGGMMFQVWTVPTLEHKIQTETRYFLDCIGNKWIENGEKMQLDEILNSKWEKECDPQGKMKILYE